MSFKTEDDDDRVPSVSAFLQDHSHSFQSEIRFLISFSDHSHSHDNFLPPEDIELCLLSTL